MPTPPTRIWYPWRQKVVGGVLVLGSLVGLGLADSRAQLEYNGGYGQTHRTSGDRLGRTRLRSQTRPVRKTPSSSCPDGGFYYPSYSSARTSATRSYSARASLPNSLLSGRSYGISAAVLPWNRVGFQDYNEPLEIRENALAAPPRKYALEATALPQVSSVERPESALLIAHLPKHAVLWAERQRTTSTGRTRSFYSPRLQSNREYSYRVRAAWIKDGRWVSQTRKLPVRAGLTLAIYLRSTQTSRRVETSRR